MSYTPMHLTIKNLASGTRRIIMFILLLESQDNIINSVTAQLNKRYPKSCQGFINESVRYDALSDYKMKPLLAKGWLLHCNCKLSVSYLKYLQKMPETNLYLFRVDSRRSFNELRQRFDDLEIPYRAIDNFMIPKVVVINYVMDELKIPKDVAEYLYRRHGGYLRDIITSVRVLKSFSPVNKNVIRKYTVPSSKARLFDLITYVVDPNSSVSYDSIIKLLYQYQYGFDYLLTYLKEQLSLYLCIFSYINDGVVSLTNYKIVKDRLPDKRVKQLSSYQLMKIIESFDKLSFDKLYVTYQFISGLKPTKVDLIKMVEYLKVNKEVKNV